MSNSSGTTTGDKPAYRVLARKYRPSDFAGLIGQEPMVRTLTNAFQSGRIAQAWMLTGVRGVGKTTTARILARALNYETDTIDQPTVDLAEPGRHCDAIMEGRHVDVIEMDAASHTGIDDIREIIEQVRYAPVSARYKVYIIDEVHMLSTQAFNGLLKTLEEPPPHVKFIFATTEIRKVPVTVLSRCQRFDLRRVEAGTLIEHLKKIAALEEIAVDDEAFAMIARAAEGSVRDSLSILDQAIAHGGGAVSGEAVRDMLGLADRTRIIDLFEHLMKGDLPSALGIYRDLYDAGAGPSVMLADLAEFTHLVTRLRFVHAAADDAALSPDERTRGLDFSKRLSVRVLSRVWQMLLNGISEVQAAARPVNAGEMVLIRIAHAADLPTLDEALKSHGDTATSPAPQEPSSTPSSNGGGAATNAVSATSMAISGPGGAAMRVVESRPDEAVPQSSPDIVEKEPALPEVVLASLDDVAALADSKRDMAFKVTLKRYVRLVSIEEGRLAVNLADGAPKTLLNDLTRKLGEWTGRRWIVSLSREAGSQTLAEREEAERETRVEDARADPVVAAVLAKFPGARITDIRIAGADTENGATEIDQSDDDGDL